MKIPVFLTLAETLDIQRNQIEHYGGSLGIRDIKLLESALAQPQASFGGQWLHETLFEMAAAYAFHLCQNHPFVDGNKRTALATSLVFLELNQITISDPKQKLLEAMIKMADGKTSKKEFVEILKKLAGKN